eukprot:symbB.v1.2.000592.t1/scaffold26.1/size418576/7
MLSTHQLLSLLFIFGLGIAIGNVCQPQRKYVTFSNFIQRATVSSDVSTETAKAAKEAGLVNELETTVNSLESRPVEAHIETPVEVHEDGQFLKRQRGERRREHMKRELAKADLSGFFFWSAVDAKTDERLSRETGRLCPCDARLANSMSHREIYETMLQLENCMEPDVILWGHCPRGIKPRQFEKDVGMRPLTLSYGHPGSCLHAYTVSLQGAFTLAQATSPVKVPADGAMDGRKHWEAWVRPHINKEKGQAALDELLEATRRKEAELLEREAALEEGFASEKQKLLEDCRQQIHDQQSELLTQVKARENRVSAQMSKCQRKSEVELERRLALISAQERSAQEALQHRQQIQQQAEEIQHLQQRLERAESEPKLKDFSDTKWRSQVRRVRSCVGERTMRTVSRSASLTLLGQLTPSTCSSTPAGAARTKQKAEDPLR